MTSKVNYLYRVYDCLLEDYLVHCDFEYTFMRFYAFASKYVSHWQLLSVSEKARLLALFMTNYVMDKKGRLETS